MLVRMNLRFKPLTEFLKFLHHYQNSKVKSRLVTNFAWVTYLIEYLDVLFTLPQCTLRLDILAHKIFHIIIKGICCRC